MSTTRAHSGQNAHCSGDRSGHSAQARILGGPGGRTAALVLSLRSGEESPDSIEQGARRKPGAAGLVSSGPHGQGHRDVACSERCRVKRGNPHPLQPQAWPPTLLAEARVEGTSPRSKSWPTKALIRLRSEIDGRLKQDLAYSPPGTLSRFKKRPIRSIRSGTAIRRFDGSRNQMYVWTQGMIGELRAPSTRGPVPTRCKTRDPEGSPCSQS